MRRSLTMSGHVRKISREMSRCGLANVGEFMIEHGNTPNRAFRWVAKSTLLVVVLAAVGTSCGKTSESVLTAADAEELIVPLCQTLDIDQLESGLLGSESDAVMTTGDEWRDAARENGTLAEIVGVASRSELPWAQEADSTKVFFTSASRFSLEIADLVDDGEDLTGSRGLALFEEVKQANADFDGRNVAAVWRGIADIEGCEAVREFVGKLGG